VASPANQTDAHFRLAVEAAPCAMVMIDHAGKIILVNARTEELFGYSRKELLGQMIEILVPDSIRHAHRDLRKNFTKSPQARPMGAGRDLSGRRKDGSLFPVEIGLNPIPAGEGIWVLGSIVDISKRKRGEAWLRESEERFQAIADASNVLIWMSGPDKLCTFFNKGWLEFTGRTMEQEIGSGWTEGVHPEDLERCLALYETAFDARRSFQIEYRMRRNDGEYRYVIDTGVPRFGPNNTFMGYVGSCLDVTGFKREQETMMATQKLESLGILAGGLAHDFNNLQSGIIALSELMLEKPNLDSSIAVDLREIRDIAMQGSKIVHELMVYAGEDSADIEPVHLSPLVEEMRELLRLSISRRAILRIHLDPSLPPVLANATHIRQLIMNLVINASDAIGTSEGFIELTTSLGRASKRKPGSRRSNPAERACVRIVVSDTGCGMTEELQRKIFDPFFSTKTTGRGLGLAVVQGIVRRYDGVIELTSAPGQGTRFEILLPCARQEQA